MININYRDPRPIYEQVKDNFRQLIISGALPPDEKMPSVRELAASLTINPNTIQRAYRELETAGYILSVAGKGSFVAQLDALTLHERQEATQAFLDAAARLRALGLDDDALAQLLQREEKAE